MSVFSHTLRQLAHTPVFTILSVLTLTTGIVATTTIFSVGGVLLRPLPHPDSDRLVVPAHDAPGLDLRGVGFSDALYDYYRVYAEAFESIAIYDHVTATLTGSGSSERLGAMVTTASFFHVLKVPPVLGRPFSEADEGPGVVPAVILSDSLWKRRFGADPGVLGRRVHVDRVEREVGGVMPPDFQFQQTGVDLYLPARIDRGDLQLGSFGFSGVARLADGKSREAAEADLRRLLAGLEEAFPEQRAAGILLQGGFTAVVTPLKAIPGSDVEARLRIVIAAAGVVLLIACIYIAHVFMAGAEARQREKAVYTAPDATRWQRVSSAMAESLVLSLAAGGVGLGVTWLTLRWLVRVAPQELPGLREISVDPHVVAVGVTVSVVTGVVLGFIYGGFGKPSEVTGVLEDGERSATAGQGYRRAFQFLAKVLITLVLVMLMGAWILVSSFFHRSNVDVGFRSDDLVTASLWLPEADYPDDRSVAGFYQRLLEQVRALPGVESAGGLTPLPLTGSFSTRGFEVEEFPVEEGNPPPVLGRTYVTPETMETLGAVLVEGRTLDLHDQVERTGNVMVNETLARRFWEESGALGKRVRFAEGGEEDPDPWFTIVGVVRDIRIQDSYDETPGMIYFPTLGKQEGQWVARSLTLVVQAPGETLGLAESLRRTVRDLDADLPVACVRTLDEALRRNRTLMAMSRMVLLVTGGVMLAFGLLGSLSIIALLVR